jgi:hypothetical protein
MAAARVVGAAGAAATVVGAGAGAWVVGAAVVGAAEVGGAVVGLGEGVGEVLGVADGLAESVALAPETETVVVPLLGPTRAPITPIPKIPAMNTEKAMASFCLTDKGGPGSR